MLRRKPRRLRQRARLLIEEAETLGEPPDDPLLLFSVLYSSWAASYVAFDGDAMGTLAAQFLMLAEEQKTTAPRMVGHRLMAISLMCTGHIVEAKPHYDSAIRFYDPTDHRPLAMHFGMDVRVAILTNRSWTLWLLGYPEAALADIDQALKDAREIGQAPTSMYALVHASVTYIHCGNYATASAVLDELASLADEKGSLFWKPHGMAQQGCLFGLTGKVSNAVQILTAGIAAFRSTGSTPWIPIRLAYLAMAHAELGNFDDAWHCLAEAMSTIEATKERWYEAEVNRTAGEIALLSHDLDAVKAEAYFDRALAVARQQQAKSWELRASISLARLWRDQGKVHQARELLAPVYGWFTEGFDTRDLKEAKAFLEELQRG
jgi:predicted ATPase